MCMTTTTFLTKWYPKEKAWVGIGYKAYDDILDSLKRPNWSKHSKGLKPNVWITADGSWGCSGLSIEKNNSVESLDYIAHSRYPRGFHIWLDYNHALKYSNGVNTVIVKVLYKNILAFGQNSINWDSMGPCIITKNMKILEVVKKIC
jgi:hypothetical protein